MEPVSSATWCRQPRYRRTKARHRHVFRFSPYCPRLNSTLTLSTPYPLILCSTVYTRHLHSTSTLDDENKHPLPAIGGEAWWDGGTEEFWETMLRSGGWWCSMRLLDLYAEGVLCRLWNLVVLDGSTQRVVDSSVRSSK